MASWSQAYHGKEDDTAIDEWSDMKKYDDDHDNEWFICEERKMAESYGGDFVRVKYTSQGRVGYYCEICSAECNAKKSLDAHCSGMKHLKKKDLWEKEKRGIVIEEEEEEEYPTGPLKKWKPKQEPGKPPSLFRNHGGPANDNSFRDRRQRPDGPPYLRWDDQCDARNLLGRKRSPSPPKRDIRGRYDNLPIRSKIARSRSPSPKVELKQSPAGALLQKLSECSVKTEDDAQLAISVVTALTKSLKEYFLCKQDSKMADLLMESELKMSTVKALLVRGRLGLDKQNITRESTPRMAPPPPPSIAMTPLPGYGQPQTPYNSNSFGTPQPYGYSPYGQGAPNYNTASFR